MREDKIKRSMIKKLGKRAVPTVILTVIVNMICLAFHYFRLKAVYRDIRFYREMADSKRREADEAWEEYNKRIGMA